MIKFLKYDFKGSYKTLLGFLFGGVFASTLLQILIYDGRNINKVVPEILMLITGLVSMLVIVTVVVGFITYSIRMFSKELNSDRGYLTLSVPKDLTNMVLSKMLIVFVWSMIYIFVGYFYNGMLTTLLGGVDAFSIIKNMSAGGNLFVEILKNIFLLSLEATLIMTTCYFSITLSKVTFRNKKLGGLWIPIFILLIIVVNYIKWILIGNTFTINGLNMGSSYDDFVIYAPYLYYKLIALEIVMIGLFALVTGKLLNKEINI